MAFDGITIANIKNELENTILNGRIYKIAQPEADELILTIKTGNGQYRLFISVDASLPLIYLTETNKPSPMTAPGFCMLLRKHIQNGRIISITQPDFERVLIFEIEHLNEMGDLCRKKLIVEIMGKHSNIIFCDEKDMILDSIKHISALVSSVREVLPGRDYFIPKTTDKSNPLLCDRSQFAENVRSKPLPIGKAIYTSFTGISPVIAEEICHRADLDSALPASSLSESERAHLSNLFLQAMEDIASDNFSPAVYTDEKGPVEYASIALSQYNDYKKTEFDSISSLLENYYIEKNNQSRIRQKSSDLRRIVATLLDRNRKKLQLQLKQLADTEKRDKYRLYGELIHTYGYNVEDGAKSFEALNYYTNENITIPLDPDYSPMENGKRYFDKYNKLKRTFEALSTLTEETKAEISHLESIQSALMLAEGEGDLTEIKEELTECGYIRKKASKKKEKITSRPYHYVTKEGFHIYVGKNNFQNDHISFKLAGNSDWWFHVKGAPGSHVIVKTEGKELPDSVFEDAGRLAAYYSSKRESEKVEIDYLKKRNLKKPNGAKPGFVVYYTNYSLTIAPDITGLTLVE